VEKITALDVARFRLLSNIVRRQGNDEVSLGVHDSNLLFAEGKSIPFGITELSGLFTCGLGHFTNENAPLWYWFSKMNGFTKDILPMYTIMEPSKERKVGALTAMNLISEPLPEDEEPINRKFYVSAWFAKDEPSAVKVAALNYLADCGIPDDLLAIYKEFNNNDYQTANSAANAIIRINLRISHESAIKSLYELQPTSINKGILLTLFKNNSDLSTKTLLDGVEHRNDDVRLIVVELLNKRNALPVEIAEKLLLDGAAKVRYEALKTLINNDRQFSDDEVKKILIKNTPKYGLATLAFGLSDLSEEDCWSDFKLKRLHSRSRHVLESLIPLGLIGNSDAYFVLANRHFKQKGTTLRKAVADQFKTLFQEEIENITKIFTLNTEVIDKARSLEDGVRKQLTRNGLDILCSKADPSDLDLVRKTLRSGFIDYSSSDIEYLRKFGSWEDIPLIIESLKRPKASGSFTVLATASDSEKYAAAARAIYSLGRIRLTDLLQLQLPNELLNKLILEVADSAFKKLSLPLIMPFLRSEDELVRKSTALKCIRAFSKEQIESILSKYLSEHQVPYYNVIHWLDFGASSPREITLKASAKILGNYF
jgi:hypothetical protein